MFIPQILPALNGVISRLTNHTKNIAHTILIFALVATLAGCSSFTSSHQHGPHITSIEWENPTTSLAIGYSYKLNVLGIFSDNHKEDISSAINWSSNKTNIATISNDGTITPLAAGTTVITATSTQDNTKTLTLSIDVKAASLQRIELTTDTLTLVAGGHATVSATGFFSDGSRQNLTDQLSWTSSDTSIATITTVSAGSRRIIGVSAGNVVVNAVSGSVKGTVTLTISSAQLDAITIDTSVSTLAKGSTEKLNATGFFSDGSKIDLTSYVTWTSSDPTIAAVSNATATAGQMTAIGEGTASISANYLGKSAQTPITVSAATLAHIEIDAVASLSTGLKTAIKATGVYTDKSKIDISPFAVWSVDNSTLASIQNSVAANGVLTALATGTVTVTAKYLTLQATTTIVINNAQLLSIRISAEQSVIAKGVQVQLRAWSAYSDGHEEEITRSASWISSDTSIATVIDAGSDSGIVHAINIGDALIGASFDGQSAVHTIQVSAATLQSVDIMPNTATIYINSSAELSLIGTYSDATTRDISALAHWSVSQSSVAAIANSADNAGRITGLASGNAVVTAAVGALSATAALVVADTITSIDITPLLTQMVKGNSQKLTLTAHYASGATQDITSIATWSTSATAVASVGNSVTNAGTVNALMLGNATISASYAGLAANIALEVIADPTAPARINISAAPNVILNDGTDETTLTIRVGANDVTSNVADGSVVNVSIVAGTGTLSAASATTSQGVATVKLKSTFIGTISVKAEVASTSISSTLNVISTDKLNSVIVKSVYAIPNMQGTTLKAGSVFGLVITNTSNRDFNIQAFQANNGNVVLESTNQAILLSDGVLSAGESTGLALVTDADINNPLIKLGYQISATLSNSTTSDISIVIQFNLP